MTDSIPSKTRAAFEAWLQTAQGLSDEWDERRNCYKQFAAHLAWKAWHEQDKRLSEANTALRCAVEVIRTWHNMGGAEDVWPIYWRSAPEMKPIREALAGAADTSGESHDS